MNPEVKRLWVDALRSGDFRQGRGQLCLVGFNDNRSYCCLGVLSELAHRAGVVDAILTSGGKVRYVSEDDGELTGGLSYLADSTQVWAGLNHFNPMVTIGNTTAHLAAFNDSGTSFTAIADAIEAQL